MSVDTHSGRSEPDSLTRRLVQRWRVILVVLAIIAGTGALAWEWRHPDVSFDYGYGIGGPRDVGEQFWTTLADSDRPGTSPLTITSISPVVGRDDASVTVDYLVCELDSVALAEDGIVGFGYGLGPEDVDRYCTSTRPAQGADFSFGTGARKELLVGITPTQSGRSTILRHEVAYRAGWQRGSSDIFVEIKVNAR